MKNPSISVRKITLQKNMMFRGVKLLSYQIHYPEFCSPCFGRCLAQINCFYQHKAQAYQRYCETKLFCLAVQQYWEDQQNNNPIRPFEVIQDYQITDLSTCVISLYSDQYEYTGGAHGNTLRNSQTWSLPRCALFCLEELVCCPPDYKTYLLSQIERQIQKQPELYFENYKELIVQTFCKDNFYCTPQGIVFYYQQYDIAPYSSGIREFCIPYSDCVRNPGKTCR